MRTVRDRTGRGHRLLQTLCDFLLTAATCASFDFFPLVESGRGLLNERELR